MTLGRRLALSHGVILAFLALVAALGDSVAMATANAAVGLFRP